MKKFFGDFKKFITRGNIVDLAVAVVIGGAFGKIVTSLVNDIIMPLITLIVGGKSVADWKWVIRPEVIENNQVIVAESALHYGSFIQTILDFLIIAFFVFLAIRILMQAQKGLDMLEKELRNDDKEAKRKLISEGHTKKEAKAIIKQRALEAEKAKKEEEAKKAAEAAANTPEALLKDIRDLLAARQAGEVKKDD